MIVGCAAGNEYVYRSHIYRMTQSNIDHHRRSIAALDNGGLSENELFECAQSVERCASGGVHSTSTWPKDQDLARVEARLRSTCQRLTSAAAAAPESAGLDSSRELLSEDAKPFCTASLVMSQTLAEMQRKRALRAERERGKDQDAKSQAGAAERRRQALDAIQETCEKELRPSTCEVEGISDDEKQDCVWRCWRAIRIAVNTRPIEAWGKCVFGPSGDEKPKRVPTDYCEELSFPESVMPSSDLAERKRDCKVKCKEERARRAAAPSSNSSSSVSACTAECTRKGEKCLQRCDEPNGINACTGACYEAGRKCGHACRQ